MEVFLGKSCIDSIIDAEFSSLPCLITRWYVHKLGIPWPLDVFRLLYTMEHLKINFGGLPNTLWRPTVWAKTQRCDPINVSKWSGYESSTMPTWMCAFDLRFTAILLSSSHLATGCHSHVWLSRLTTAGFWGPQHHLSFYHVLLVGDYSSISTTVHYDSWDAHPT